MGGGVPVSVLTTTTFVCSILSLLGSLIVISSYRIARTKSRPKAAQLIHNLALCDFFWFLASLTMSSFWLIDPESVDKSVPTFVCFIVTPTISFTRLASLVWTCAVSFDVYMSVNRRHWDWKDEEHRWNLYRRRYVLVVMILALPATLINLITQHLSKENHNLGCSPGYEELGNWVIVVCTEVLPILAGFICNVSVYILVRRRMSQKVYPQSVRKRRRRIMYYYMIACIWCWTPTILFYCVMLFRLPPTNVFIETFEVFCRGSLYLTGFVNFLIFGMSDPHLSRSFSLVLYYMGLHACIDPEYLTESDNSSSSHKVQLRTKDVEKTVMFGGDISKTADRSSTKRDSLRYKLSNEEKENLYKFRPDLDTRSDNMRDPLLNKKRRKKRPSSGGTPGPEGGDINSSGSSSSSSSIADVEAAAGGGLLHERLQQMESSQTTPLLLDASQYDTSTSSSSGSVVITPAGADDDRHSESKADDNGSEVMNVLHSNPVVNPRTPSPAAPSSSSSSAGVGAGASADPAQDIEAGASGMYTSPEPLSSSSSSSAMNIDHRYSYTYNDMEAYNDNDNASVSSEGSSAVSDECDSSDDEDDEEDRELKSPIKRGEQS